MDLVPVELTVGAVLAYAAWDLVKDWRPSWPTPRQDPVVAVDRVHTLHKVDNVGMVPTMVAARYRLRGRPDELRRAPDGRIVPVEIKSTRAPRNGLPYPSHRVQLLAYCLLLEEATGAAPPYEILSYGDGTEISVPWDDGARGEVLEVLQEWRRPYEGAMDAAPGKCRTCQFRGVCPGASGVGLN